MDTYTAEDVVARARELDRHPMTHEWFTLWIDYLRNGKNILVNTNRLVKDYKGCDGLKTGYTEEAGYCLAATAKRDGLRLISVVLGLADSKVRFAEAAKLLDYGFRYFVGVPVAKAGQAIAEVKVLRGRVEKVPVMARGDAVACVERGSEGKVKIETTLEERVTAPIAKGQKLGEVVASVDGRDVVRVDLVAGEEVERGSILQILLRMIRDLFRAIFGRINSTLGGQFHS